LSRPVVGITTYVEPATWGAWERIGAVLVPHGYVRHVEQAGAVAILLPPRLDVDDDIVATVLGRLDALVIAGGADVEPARYHAAPHPRVQPPRRDRDATELALVRAAVAVDLPLLGICRGMQVMAVAAGGTLIQHVPDLVDSERHCPAPARYGWTPVLTSPGSILAGIVGDRLVVPCHHHQAVAVAPGYVVSAVADDGLTEAIEATGSRFRVGVQWHPESTSDARLIKALVRATR
jgi:putative glutamine amidotransferase